METKLGRYYYCVNCGNAGDFKRPKKRSVQCQECGYKEITPLDEQEYNQELKQREDATKAFKKFSNQ